MLNLMRRFAKSWLLKGVLGLLALTFVSFYAVIDRNQENALGDVATVNGTKISQREFEDSYDRLVNFYRQAYQDRLTEDMIKKLDLKRTALESLIVREVELQAARRAGLSVSPQELLAAIRSRPEFKLDGRFDSRVYFDVLRNNRLTPEEFENSVRNDLLLQKWKTLIELSAPVTEQEVRLAFRELHEKLDLVNLPFRASDYASKVKVDAKALKKYFQDYAEEFRQPEKVRLEYLFWNPRTFEAAVKVTPGEVEDYYYAHEGDFRVPESVHARHILFRVPEGADAKKVAEIRARAESVEKQLKKGANFAALARKYSQGPSAARGGDLGTFHRGEMVPEFEQAAFSLKPGEISGLVRTRFGFHIIQVLSKQAAKLKPLQQVRAQIEQDLKRKKSVEQAESRAAAVGQSFKGKESLRDLVGKSGAQYKETSWVTAGQPIAGVPGWQAVASAAFPLRVGEVSSPVTTREGVYLVRVLQKKESHIPPLAEITGEVEKSFVRRHSLELASRDAAEASRKIGAGADPKKEAAALHVQVQELNGIDRREFLTKFPALETDLETIRRVFNAKPGVPVQVQGKDAVHVFVVRSRHLPDEKVFQKERADILEALRAQRYQALPQVYLQRLMERAKILRTPGAV